LCGGLILLAACAAPVAEQAPAPPEPEGPRLVLFVVVDQMRADYLDRFGPLFTGGLARLNAESVRFSETYHDHATTETAPGHATLATGLYPSHHGVIANWWFDRAEGDFVYGVSDPEDGRSPRNLDATTLGSWIKAADPASKVFAASGKDRAAILTAGKEADGAFWYDHDDGGFQSSTYYYPQEPPAWLRTFNEASTADRYFATLWQPLPATATAIAQQGAALAIEATDLGPLHPSFPHSYGGLDIEPDDGFYGALYDTPILDERLLELARALIVGEELGQDGHLDFLGLSFSALDTVGHDYGPNSPEVLDTLLRLDQVLGELLDFVDRTVGLEHVIVSLSADHGVLPLPEYSEEHGQPGRRLVAAERPCYQHVGRGLRDRFGDRRWVRQGEYLDEAAIAAAGLDLAEVESEAARLLGACPGVARVWTRDELERPETVQDPIGRLFVHVLHPQRRANLYVQYESGFLPVSAAVTTHGSPYPYDTHVPWLLRLPGVEPARIGDTVYTVDVAPTIAARLGVAVQVPADLDGVDRLP
jgi:predicted AlkP superfamily pyrophosphatase or phosphodiesterase